MNWFGEPWPSEQRRAPVCEDDADRVPVPLNLPCLHCGEPFGEQSRGVRVPMLGEVFLYAHYHAKCMLAEVVGERMALEISARGGFG